MKYRLINLGRSIKNLITWLPIIWKDQQWDSSFDELILLHKIRLKIKYFETPNDYRSTGIINDIKWMKVCERLLTNITTSVYWQDKYDILPSSNGIEGSWWEYYKTALGTKRLGCDFWEYKARRLFWLIYTSKYKEWWD